MAACGPFLPQLAPPAAAWAPIPSWGPSSEEDALPGSSSRLQQQRLREAADTFSVISIRGKSVGKKYPLRLDGRYIDL